MQYFIVIYSFDYQQVINEEILILNIIIYKIIFGDYVKIQIYTGGGPSSTISVTTLRVNRKYFSSS